MSNAETVEITKQGKHQHGGAVQTVGRSRTRPRQERDQAKSLEVGHMRRQRDSAGR